MKNLLLFKIEKIYLKSVLLLIDLSIRSQKSYLRHGEVLKETIPGKAYQPHDDTMQCQRNNFFLFSLF